MGYALSRLDSDSEYYDGDMSNSGVDENSSPNIPMNHLDHDVAQLTKLRSAPHEKLSRSLPGKREYTVSIVKMLAGRECNYSGRGRFSSADRCHVLSKYLPVSSPRVVDQMTTRAYVSQFSADGSLCTVAFQYRISRKTVVDQTFSRFRIGKQEIGNTWSTLDWEQVMVRLKLGIRAINVCSRIIFPREKKYYEQIFAGIECATYDDCFLVIITDAAIQLCDFAETITTTSVSLQKLFGVLDLYKALVLLLPDIKVAFHSSSSVDVYFRTAKIVDRVAELVRHIVSTFEDTVFNEQLNTLSGHIIHPLTTYSMDYVIGMIKFEELLVEIIISKPTISLGISDDDRQFLEVGGKTPFALHLVWIFIILKFNLEGKSKQYVDASMGHLFMIKNVKLIVAKIEQHSELQEMIGEDYLTMLGQYVAKKAVTYVEFVRDKALRGLRDEGLNHKFLLFSRISKSALKKRLKIFNAMLEDFFGTRSTWLVPDLQLQGQLDKLMFEELIPAYESFLIKYRRHVESEKYPGKYIKYLPEDLKDELDGKRKVFSTIK